MSPGPSRTPIPVPRPAAAGPPARIWGGLVLLAAAASIYRSDDTDVWFHLAAGRSILAHGLPAHESWCVAAQGQAPWLSEWLFHVALFGVHALGGDAAIGVWRALWSALAMVLAIVLLRTIGAASWRSVGLACLALAVARERFQPRPEQIGTVLCLLYLLAFERARRGLPARLAWLVPVQVVWANVHPSWIFGVLIASLYALGSRLRGEAAPAGTPRRLALLALAGASLLTPAPLDSLTLPLRFLGNLARDPLHAAIEELRPWSWVEDRASPFAALLVLGALALALGARRAWRQSPELLVAALGATGLGLAALRSRGLAAFLLLPVLALALGSDQPRRRSRVAQALALLAAVAGLGWLAFARGFTPGVAPQWRAVPVRAVALAESLALSGVPLNTFHYGGYLLWVRGDSHPPLIDGRAIGTPGFRSRYVRAYADSAALDSLLAEWPITHAVLAPPETPDDRLAAMLLRRPEWSLVFSDDAGLLLVRRDRFPAVAAAREYRDLSPDYPTMAERAARALADSTLEHALVAELERARAESPWHARASLWLGLLRLTEGDGRAALALLEEVDRLAPATPGLALRLGLARENAGDRAGARAAYRRALAEPGDRSDAEQRLSQLGRAR